MRESIKKNMLLLAEGHFSDDELTFALSTNGLPYVDREDNELDTIIESGDVSAWNDYVQAHTEIVDHATAKRRILIAREAALDLQAINEHPELSFEEAIEAVVMSRQEEIICLAQFDQSAMEAAARNGFPI